MNDDSKTSGASAAEPGLNLFQSLTALLIVVILVCLGYVFGAYRGYSQMRVEAVSAGHAQWIPDVQGNSTFEWLNHTPETRELP